MHRDIEVAKELGATGVVVGVLTPDEVIDAERTAALIARARPLDVTFHKAFDRVRDPFLALDELIELGVDRVLTSGGRATALEGIKTLAALVERANGRLSVMAGGQLDAQSVRRVIREAHVKDVHLGSAVIAAADDSVRGTSHDGRETGRQCVDARRVAGIVDLVRSLEQAD